MPIADGSREQENGVRAACTPTGRSRAVLIVDDEPLVRRVVRRVLEASGWKVLEAATGCEGVERLRQSDQEICCVLLDRVMPGMDGERTFRALREVRADLPILFVTGVPDPGMKQRLSGQERLGYLDKPFRMAELQRQLQQIVALADPPGRFQSHQFDNRNRGFITALRQAQKSANANSRLQT